MTDIFSEKKRSEIMSKIKGRNTKIELLVRKWIYHFGYRYRLNDRRYPGSPDIVIPKYKTAIFIHGCFWHAHSNCRLFKMPKSSTAFWEAKFKRNIKRDESKITALEENGWNVIVVWECELKTDSTQRLINLLSEIKQIKYE